MPAERTIYTRVNWVNKVTKLNAENLNNLDEGIAVNNALAIENANLLDELYAALIEQLEISYDQNTNTFTISIGSSIGDNPTTTFNVTKSILIDTHTSQLSSLINGLSNGDTVVAKATGDESGNNIKSSYGSSLDLTTTFNSTTGQFVLSLVNKNGNTLISKTFTIPKATTENVGLLSPGDKTKINNIATDIENLENRLTNTINNGLDNKVNKLTGSSKVYIRGATGGDGGKEWSVDATGNSFVVRDSHGNIRINTAQAANTNESYVAIHKGYVDDKVARSNLVAVLGEASTSLNGLMSTQDKTKLEALYSLLGDTADADTVVNTINEVLAIFNQYPEGSEVVSALAAKANASDVYTKAQIDELLLTINTTLSAKANSADVYTKSEIQAMFTDSDTDVIDIMNDSEQDITPASPAVED